ncbi:MAG: sigma-54 dependent transcriptional regulator [Betaproteobacteria bacterium]|nr:sigma-54 dependent transcriptional regulator [Betaproteobacteria bacterium]
MTLQLLIVDDEHAVRQILAANLEKAGYAVDQAGRAEDALAKLATGEFDVALCDICLPDFSGIDVLRQARASGLDTRFIMITGFASIDTAIEAMRAGAADYIIKPLRNEEVLHRLRLLADLHGMRDENRMLRRLVMGEAESRYRFTAPAMREVEHMLSKVAPTDSTVLISGESGVGKNVVAREIHRRSRRSEALCLPVNCGAIPDALVESEFFGHTKGAFTGADKARKGLFLQADGGTLLLDEIGDLPLPVQSKLLQVLEEKQVRAVGSERVQRVDVRIIAATNRELGEMVAAKKFREDLYFRLSAFHVHVPPLREMRADIPGLVRFLLERPGGRSGPARRMSVDPLAEELLASYDWPGNLRELRNVIERACILSEGERITLGDLPPEIGRAHPGHGAAPPQYASGSLRRMIHEYEASVLLQAIQDAGGDRRLAAQRLGVALSTLYRKLEEHERSSS